MDALESHSTFAKICSDLGKAMFLYGSQFPHQGKEGLTQIRSSPAGWLPVRSPHLWSDVTLAHCPGNRDGIVFNVYSFLRKTERERERGREHEWGRGRERRGQRIPSMLCADRPMRGSNSRTVRS